MTRLVARVSRWPRGAAIAAGWLLVAVVAASLLTLRALAGRGDLPSLQELAGELLFVALWAAATPPLFAAVRRWPLRGPASPRRLAGYLLAFGVFLVATNALARLALLATEGGGRELARQLLLAVATYCVPAALAFAALLTLGHWIVQPAVRPASTVLQLAPPPRPPREPAGDGPDHLLVTDRRGLQRVPLDAVLWIEAEDNYALIHVPGRAVSARTPIAELAGRLERRGFVRVHRSALVRAGAVEAIRPLGHGDFEVQLQDGTTVRGSRSRRAAIRQLQERLRAE
jgi:DNA-binding LytR/AlgR family response regulator